ncbi:hypothetical protein Tco_0531087 [Tanacetum coccineum]
MRGLKTARASRIVEDQMKNTLKTEHPSWRESSRLHMYEDPPDSLGLQLPAGKKASQRLWMFKVKEEQNSSENEPFCVGALNDTSTQHKSEGFQLAGQKENLECRLKEILYGLIQASRLWYLKFDSSMQKDKMMDRCSEKQVLGYVFTVGITTVEWESKLQKSITIDNKSLIHLMKNLKVCSWAKLVRILISEGSLSLLKILGTKSLAEMLTRLNRTKSLAEDITQVCYERELKVLRRLQLASTGELIRHGKNVLLEREERGYYPVLMMMLLRSAKACNSASLIILNT